MPANNKTILMCAPKYFDIEYEINPWMDTDNQVDTKLAGKQWQKLYEIYTEKLGWDVQLIEPVKGLPDMVFTANGGLVYKDKVVLPRFRQPDRQPETEKFEAWFKAAGYQDIWLPKYDFEGEGDALFWNDILLAGYPWRSDKPSHKEVSEFLGAKTLSLQLVDPKFYHLDTALTVISQDTVSVYPGAFSPDSLNSLRELVPNVIEASQEDAMAYGLNAMSDGKSIVISDRASGLINEYKKQGLNIYPTPISEFQKSGGGVKCLTLDLSS